MIKKENIFEFNIFDKLLKKSLSDIGASEAHGIIVASICLSKNEEILKTIIYEFLGVQQNKKIIFNFIKQLRNYNSIQLKSIDNMISLMIPNREEALCFKINNLKLWVKGFISGIGLFGLTKHQCNIPIIYEIINDFSMITRTDGLNNKKEEIYYIDLLEYVKISVEIIYFEIKKFKKI